MTWDLSWALFRWQGYTFVDGSHVPDSLQHENQTHNTTTGGDPATRNPTQDRPRHNTIRFRRDNCFTVVAYHGRFWFWFSPKTRFWFWFSAKTSGSGDGGRNCRCDRYSQQQPHSAALLSHADVIQHITASQTPTATTRHTAP